MVQLAQILMQKGDEELEVRQVSFASALKTMAAKLVTGRQSYFNLGLPLGVADELWQLGMGLTLQDLKEKTPRGRKFLQFLGTEAMRKNVDDLYWVKRAADKIATLPSETQIVFIPDCRFINEADYVRNVLGGEVWRIKRYVKTDNEWEYHRFPYDNKLTPEQKAHPSETQLDDYQFDQVLRATDEDELFHAVEAQIRRLQKDGKL